MKYFRVMNSDGFIRSIRRALTNNPMIDNTRISIGFENDNIYLWGFVSTAAEKHIAELEAREASQGKTVISRIEIIPRQLASDTDNVGEILLGLSCCPGFDLPTSS
jgi:hypothetical protein